MRIVLLGPPGAGKGTQAQVLSEKVGVPHVASGDLLREHRARGTELGKAASRYMDKGLLVPDEVLIPMVMERIARPDCRKGFVLDGFPRTLEQARVLDRGLEVRGTGLDMVLHLKVSEEELTKRLGGRLTCRSCQAPYHQVSAPPRVAGRCDRCGGELYQRSDETAEALRTRFRVFWEQTEPLVEYYKGRGKLAEVDGERSIEAVGQSMLEAARASRQVNR
ncbi:MAG: adenylate kinase [Chloroflexi bacterium]|nr:adenylate kinase [Chloroflexota bacterium]